MLVIHLFSSFSSYRVFLLCKWHFSLLFIRCFFKSIKLKSCHRISLDILFFSLIFLQAFLKDRKIACCCFLFYLFCSINSVVFQVFLICIFPCFWPFLPSVLPIFACILSVFNKVATFCSKWFPRVFYHLSLPFLLFNTFLYIL